MHKSDCTDVEEIPCGCWFGSHGDSMVFSPCSKDCSWYKFTMITAIESGQPVDIITLKSKEE